MKHRYQTVLLAATMAATALTSCRDNNYDLSDIDTTTRINVNDLTVPINLSDIKMSSIIDLENEGIVQIVNNQYCIVQQSDFESSEIQIDPVTMTCNDIESTSKWLEVPTFPGMTTMPAGLDLSFPLHSDPSRFDVNAANVTDCIKSIEEIGTDLHVTFTLSLKGFGHNNLKGFNLKGLTLLLPKHLLEVNTYGQGKYNAATGEFRINDRYVDGEAESLTISFGRVNFAASGINFNAANHSISFVGTLGVTAGDAIVNTSDIKDRTKIPSQVEYTVDYNIDDIPVHSFTGGIDYTLDDFDMPTISLTDLPDVLSQPGTDISLVNPQIYISLHNPLAANNAKGSIGLDIIAERNEQPDQHYPMASPLAIPAQTDVMYVLSPLADFTRPEGYENAIHHPYAQLGEVVSGNGLPNMLTFKPIDTDIDTDRVIDLKIGKPLGKFTGTYYLLAPLQLANGSKIIYSSVSDGWADDSDDLAKLTIERLSVSALISSDVPIAMEFTLHPLDSKGDIIPGVEVTKVTVPANAKDFKLELTATGQITDLDGIQYTALAAPGENAAALSDKMTIAVKNLRAKVSGHYTTDFD